jgi:hypothetical protein
LYTILCLREPFEDEDESIIPSLVAQCRRPKLPAYLLSIASPESESTSSSSGSGGNVINFTSLNNDDVLKPYVSSTNLSATQYRNLIDLYEFCTTPNSNKRPPIEIVQRYRCCIA